MREGALEQILLVDDDAAFRQALAARLALGNAFDVREAADAREARSQAQRRLSDLILLDVGLPDMDGRELCRVLRRDGVKCPIIMLTGTAEDSDIVLGLESGANDYVAKPFKFEVLLARMRGQLRQHQQSENAVFAIGPYTFQPAAKLLINAEAQVPRRVRLTEKEVELLKHLYRAGGRTVEREVLLTEVLGCSPLLTTHTLETHVYRLRQKIEAGPTDPALLVTAPGGYRLERTS